jgi:hypothetical protein
MLSVDRQQPPPKLKTSMVGPLGDAVDTPTSATIEVEDVDSGPRGGAVSRPATTTTKVEDIDGRPPDLYLDM